MVRIESPSLPGFAMIPAGWWSISTAEITSWSKENTPPVRSCDVSVAPAITYTENPADGEPAYALQLVVENHLRDILCQRDEDLERAGKVQEVEELDAAKYQSRHLVRGCHGHRTECYAGRQRRPRRGAVGLVLCNQWRLGVGCWLRPALARLVVVPQRLSQRDEREKRRVRREREVRLGHLRQVAIMALLVLLARCCGKVGAKRPYSKACKANRVDHHKVWRQT